MINNKCHKCHCLGCSSPFVQIEGSKSTTRTLTCWVPQASVLGILLYVLYTAPVADIIKSHNLYSTTSMLTTHNYTSPLRPTVMLMLACPGQGLNTVLQISTDG